jgi:hypothetical protein
MSERGELRVAPEAEHAEEHRQVPEHLVPAIAHPCEPLKLGVQQPRILLDRGIAGRSFDRRGMLEERPLLRLLFHPFLDGLQPLFHGGAENLIARPRLFL